MTTVPGQTRYTELVIEQDSGMWGGGEGGGGLGLLIIRVCMIIMTKYRLELSKPDKSAVECKRN